MIIAERVREVVCGNNFWWAAIKVKNFHSELYGYCLVAGQSFTILDEMGVRLRAKA